MQQILSEIYQAHLLTKHLRWPEIHDKMQKTESRIVQIGTALSNQLTLQQKEQLDSLLDEMTLTQNLESEKNFMDGFLLGARLMLQILLDNDEETDK